MLSPSYFLRDRRATRKFAEQLACSARVGDVFCLQGPVGVGKSEFIRYFIRSKMNDPALSVPSPTFSLMNSYSPPVDACKLFHIDLYRLRDYEAWSSLQFPALFESGACLIEWPDRVSSKLPIDRILTISLADSIPLNLKVGNKAPSSHSGSRILTFETQSTLWKERLDLMFPPRSVAKSLISHS